MVGRMTADFRYSIRHEATIDNIIIVMGRFNNNFSV